jgi:hypothetical protein
LYHSRLLQAGDSLGLQKFSRRVDERAQFGSRRDSFFGAEIQGMIHGGATVGAKPASYQPRHRNLWRRSRGLGLTSQDDTGAMHGAVLGSGA